VAIAGHVLDQPVPLTIHGRPLVQGLDRQKLHRLQARGPLLQGFDHQSNVAPTPQGHPYQIANDQSDAIGIGVGEHLPFPAGLHPHLNPGGACTSLGCPIGIRSFRLDRQACATHHSFLRCEG
jgi:hypothetical protein